MAFLRFPLRDCLRKKPRSTFLPSQKKINNKMMSINKNKFCVTFQKKLFLDAKYGFFLSN